MLYYYHLIIGMFICLLLFIFLLVSLSIYSHNVPTAPLIIINVYLQEDKIMLCCLEIFYTDKVPHGYCRYGRYRPWWSPLEKKLKGWQIAWWHYAQESVLSDVRQRLKRTSWKYLGERL